MVLPLPPGLRARGASQKTLLTSLLRLSLIEEQPTADPALSWRRNSEGQHQALRLTSAGLVVILGEFQPSVEAEVTGAMEAGPDIIPAKTPSPVSDDPAEIDPPAMANRPSGKNGQVLDAVAATGGATLGELVALTGWQPHTTRAALTRLRQRGFSVYLETDGGRKAYRAEHVVQA